MKTESGNASPLAAPPCSHLRRRDVGSSFEGVGSIIVYWCPDCGALKRTMTNWRYTDHPWELPRDANTQGQPPKVG